MADPRIPSNIIQMQKFEAHDNVPVGLSIAEVLLLMPIFRWTGVEFIDATGEYDLCMDADGKKYHFIKRTAGSAIFAYRFVSTVFLASRR